MKLLLAIKSENARSLADNALRWCARTGYDLRIFIPKGKFNRYKRMLKEANYDWYLNTNSKMLVVGVTPTEWAMQRGYKLVVIVPDTLASWKPEEAHQDIEVLTACTEIGQMRKVFSENPKKASHMFNNGAMMVRL